MKLKSLAFFAFVLFASSCGIDALEERIDELEEALGANEPLNVKFSTVDGNNVAIEKNATCLFKPGGDNESINKETDGTVDVYIERYFDLQEDEGAYIYFEYNPETKEVTSQQAGIWFYNQFRNRIDPYFDSSDDDGTITITVNSLNVETGQIDVSVEASTTAASSNNQYTGKPMTGTFKFKGRLPVFEDN